MSDDMRLLTLTHLRAALERRDWSAVERVYRLLKDTETSWPGESPGGASTGRQMGSLAANARGPDGWNSLGNVR